MSIQLASLTTTQLRHAADLKEKIEALTKELSALLGVSAPVTVKMSKKKRGMSAAGRAKVAAGQKARWAKVVAERDLKQTSRDNKKIRHQKPKRKMSAVAKAKISAAAKARWAKIKATAKKSL